MTRDVAPRSTRSVAPTTDIEAALNQAWRALQEVDRLTADPNVRRAVGETRDGLRKIERAAKDV